MKIPFRVVLVVIAVSAVSLCAETQVGKSSHTIVLPNPQLIHCHTAQCSQLWKEDSPDGGVVYPAQIRTDLVNGSIEGLTAVYDKAVSIEEIRTAIDDRYAKWAIKDLNDPWLWRVEPEQLVIQLAKRPDGTAQLIYLKLGAHSPAAHVNEDNCS